MRELKTSLLTAFGILLVFFLYTKFAGPVPFSVNSIQTTKTNLFSVSGEGKATGIPDTAPHRQDKLSEERHPEQ